jgi:signal transduction histidine kinase
VSFSIVMWVMLVVNIALLSLAVTLLLRYARRRGALTARLEQQREQFEQQVRQRTIELTALSSHLQLLSEKEKAELARQLHDELGGLLIAAKMDAAWLQKRWPGPAPEIQGRWARVLKLLDDAVNVKRRIVENLRPTLLDNIGLLPAVRWMVQETCSTAGLHYTEIYPEQEPELRADAGIMLFRLVQESLNNIVKHARATHARVEVDINDQRLQIVIEDNGTGIESDRREAVGSHGLATMRHRVRTFNGNLELEACVGGGTRVRASLPLEGILRNPPARAALAVGEG